MHDDVGGAEAKVGVTSQKLTNEMVRRLIRLREQVDRGGSF